ncbi:MAG: tetraacyldisaccharide 4'-kinase [Alphaproteobacteria bacterium]|nr:tetraacyldisaccharide 4'-kinase [Alphaproteobacteria bacterium]
MIKTPAYWYRNINDPAPLKEALLKPFSGLYQWVSNIQRSRFRPFKADIPVICIGNLVAGGSGKTPTAIALLRLLKEQNPDQKICFLTRGYGGIRPGPLLVDPTDHIYREVGDEALLLANHAPVIVAVDRAKGAKLAMEHGMDLILMDDGLQNPGLEKDLKIVVINGEMGFGNQKTLPAGPLREPLEKGLEDADMFILIGDDVRNTADMLPKDKPLMRGTVKPANTIPLKSDTPYFAFAGMGYPEKFFNFLRDDLKLNIVKTKSFPDHHAYRRDDISALHDEAQKLDARLLTTAKDMVRVPPPAEITEDLHLDVLNITLEFDDPAPLLKQTEQIKARFSDDNDAP